MATNGRGRPPVYTESQRAKIVEMVREFGALKTQEILRARSGSKLAEYRDNRIFPKGVQIAFPTVLRIATKEGGVVLRRGRRPTESVIKTNTDTETETVTEPATATDTLEPVA